MHRYHLFKPEPPPINWWPMILAAPIVFLPLGLERRGFVQPYEWVLAWLAVAGFLVLFAIALVSWQRRLPFLWIVVPLACLGAAFSSFVYTSVVFLVYAACIVPWAVQGHRSLTIRYTCLIIAVLVALGWLMPPGELRNWYWVVSPLACITCAAFFAWVVRTTLNVQRLAELAERERIARDLHDVLGHTLSLIVLKTELAGRRLSQQHDVARARLEMADVESISRQALADVRQTILGDRVERLEDELGAPRLRRGAGVHRAERGRGGVMATEPAFPVGRGRADDPWHRIHSYDVRRHGVLCAGCAHAAVGRRRKHPAHGDPGHAARVVRLQWLLARAGARTAVDQPRALLRAHPRRPGVAPSRDPAICVARSMPARWATC